MRAAGRAIGILAQLEFAELHVQRIDQQQPADQRLAFAQNQLDDFGRLHHADQSGQNSQHAAFGAGWHQSRRWRLGIQAAVARAFLGREDAGLAFEAENRSVDIRLAGEHAGVVHQIARGKVVGAVGDDVELAKQFERIFAGEPGIKFPDVQKRIDRLQLFGGGVQLLAAHVGSGVDDLALQVGVVHDIEVHDAERAHAGRAQIQRQGRTQSARADAEHPRGFQLELPFHADLGHDQVARVAQNFVVAKGCGFGFDFGDVAIKTSLKFQIQDFRLKIATNN